MPSADQVPVKSQHSTWCDDAHASMPARHSGSFWKEGQDRTSLQLPADDYLASGINSVNLEYRLGDIETDCRDHLHRSLL
jgi:hypothetical protein